MPLLHLLGVIACLVVFERASNYLVEGLGAFSKHFDLSEAVLGASVAAMGSSAPEFGSSVFSVVEGHPTIGLGTIFGSAIFNITVIVGAVALLGKFTIERRVLYRDGLFYLFTTVVAIVGVWDGHLTRLEAVVWSLIFLGYIGWLVHDARVGRSVPHEHFKLISLGRAIVYIVLGLVAIGVAAHYLVLWVAELSAGWGVSEAVFSLVVVAAGTSVPDLFTSLQASRRGMGSMAVSNVLGSNVFDILACLGIPFSFRATTGIEMGIGLSAVFLLATVGLILAILRYRWSVSRWEGVLLLGVYGAYLAVILSGI